MLTEQKPIKFDDFVVFLKKKDIKKFSQKSLESIDIKEICLFMRNSGNSTKTRIET